MAVPEDVVLILLRLAGVVLLPSVTAALRLAGTELPGVAATELPDVAVLALLRLAGALPVALTPPVVTLPVLALALALVPEPAMLWLIPLRAAKPPAMAVS